MPSLLNKHRISFASLGDVWSLQANPSFRYTRAEHKQVRPMSTHHETLLYERETGLRDTHYGPGKRFAAVVGFDTCQRSASI